MDNGWDVFVMVGVTVTFAGAFVVTFAKTVVVTFVGTFVVTTGVGTGVAGVSGGVGVGVGVAVCIVFWVTTVVWAGSADPFVAFDDLLNPGIMPEKNAPMIRKIMTAATAMRPHFRRGPRPFFCTGNSLP
jgi:hypothetical protein